MTKRRSGGVRAEVGTNQGNEWVGVGEQYTSKWNSARVNLRQKMGWIGAFLRWKLIIAPISRAPLHGCRGASLPKLSKRFQDEKRGAVPYNQIFAPMPFERMYDGNRAVLQCDQIVAPISSGRLFGVVGEKSIEYPRKVYRVFPESL